MRGGSSRQKGRKDALLEGGRAYSSPGRGPEAPINTLVKAEEFKITKVLSIIAYQRVPDLI